MLSTQMGLRNLQTRKKKKTWSGQYEHAQNQTCTPAYAQVHVLFKCTWRIRTIPGSQTALFINADSYKCIQLTMLTHRHSDWGCMSCSVFQQECTVAPWWLGRELHGSAAASETHRSSETKHSTPTWDNLQETTNHGATCSFIQLLHVFCESSYLWSSTCTHLTQCWSLWVYCQATS